jgi:hypothetical protein
MQVHGPEEGQCVLQRCIAGGTVIRPRSLQWLSSMAMIYHREDKHHCDLHNCTLSDDIDKTYNKA